MEDMRDIEKVLESQENMNNMVDFEPIWNPGI
jgi:hypothetical protein